MFRWLVTINALDSTGNARTLRFSDGRFTRDGVPYFPRLAQPGLYRFGMQAGPLVSAQVSGFGETELINNDGGLNYLADYAIDGRELVIERVNNDFSITEVLRGTATGFEFADTSVLIRLRDPREPLEEAHPHETYAGDNVLPEGLEGVEEDLQGVPKPQVFGEVVNAAPPMVNTARLIYQVSSRPDCRVLAVYDEGVELVAEAEASSLSDLEAVEPAAGQYRWYQGCFRLGASPIGTVTCDATTGSALAGDVLAMLCGDVALTATPESVEALNAVGRVGLYLEDPQPTRELIDRLIVSVGAFWRIDVGGEVVADLLTVPESQEADATLYPYMISQADRTAVGVGENGLPVWRVEMEVDHLVTTQESVAGSVPVARKSRLRRSHRTARAESTTTKDRHRLSRPYRETSLMRSVSEAEAVCQRLLDLYSPRRDRISMTVQAGKRTDAQVGDVIDVEYPPFGYETPRRMLLIGVELDAQSNLQRLQLWG